MELAVVLSNSYFLSLAFLFACLDETASCDTKWIRYVYMMSCGRKKRESLRAFNDTFLKNIPLDLEGAVRYFKEKDPLHPMVKNDALLKEILREDERNFRLNSQVPKFLILEEAEQTDERTEPPSGPARAFTQQSALIKKLFPKLEDTSHSGIPGFPDQWDIEEMAEEKINDNHRREINRLIEECCKVPPVTTCNGNTFSGACK